MLICLKNSLKIWILGINVLTLHYQKINQLKNKDMAKRFNGKLISMLSNVKNVYKHNWASDVCANEIKDNITFADILFYMTKGQDVYEIIFKDKDYIDSVVRERIFTLLAIVSGLKQTTIYNIWYNSVALKDNEITIDKLIC